MSDVRLYPFHPDSLTADRGIHHRFVSAAADYVIGGDRQPGAEGEACSAVLSPHQHPAEPFRHRA